MAWSQSFSKPVPLGCDFHKCFLVFCPPLSGAGRLKRIGVEYFPSSRSVKPCLNPSLFGPGKIALPKKNRIVWAYFRMVIFCSPARSMREFFSDIH